MRSRGLDVLVLVLVLALVAGLVGAEGRARASTDEPATPVWHERGAAGEVRVHVYFFWSTSCPHCRDMHADLDAIAAEAPWLIVHAHEVTQSAENARAYRELASSLGHRAQYVPGLALCGRLEQGARPRDELRAEIQRCRDEGVPAASDEVGAEPLRIPGLGSVDVSRWSLLLSTVVIAGLDAFNPCAFFVLLFLLSLLIHARSRSRMLLVAGVFIAFSGLWYFVFMAAWLNVFLWIGELRAITVIAGAVALVMGGLNIKDFFRPGVGPTLSIPEAAKPGLFRRMRRLVQSSRLASVLTGAVVLAAAANTYEMLCTAGFPMIYTRILTLHRLGAMQYYSYLALYNAVYVLPLVAIVAVFVKTLGSRKLQEHEGRALKLVSGIMMAGLGALLVAAPGLLSNLLAAVALMLAAVGITVVATRWQRRSA